MEPRLIEAQQGAVQIARARYEQGEIAYETLRAALDAIVAARSPDECDAILRDLPAAPLSALAALEAPAPRPLATTRPQAIVAFMSEIKKLRRAWELQPNATISAIMGEVKLDLGRAALPPRATIHVRSVMGGVTLYIPRTAHVRVRSRVYLGDNNIMGEGSAGVVASADEEHIPVTEPARAEIEIEAFTFMGNLKVVLTDGSPTVSIGELVRDVLSAAAAGFQRGLRQIPESPRGDAPLRVTGGNEQ